MGAWAPANRHLTSEAACLFLSGEVGLGGFRVLWRFFCFFFFGGGGLLQGFGAFRVLRVCVCVCVCVCVAFGGLGGFAGFLGFGVLRGFEGF